MAKNEITRDQAARLLYAIHNVGGNASPETPEGLAFAEGCRAEIDRRFRMPDSCRLALAQGEYAAGQLIDECLAADDPAACAEEQIRRGLSGERHSH